MKKLFTVSLLILFCVSCHTISRLPEQNRELWQEFTCRYEGFNVSYKLPIVDYSNTCDIINARVIENPNRPEGFVGNIFASYYDFGYRSDVPDLMKFTMKMDIFEVDNNYKGGVDIHEFSKYWLASISQDHTKYKNHQLKHVIETSNGREWLHVSFFKNGILVSDNYTIPIRTNQLIIYNALYYDVTSKDKEWLKSRRKIAEDIFKSIKIEKNSNKNISNPR